MIRRVSLIPNTITAFGLITGLFVIFRAVSPIEPAHDLLRVSAWLLILVSICDVLDGAVARLLHGESDFGLNFDSLADAISFGIAPAVLMVKTLPTDVSKPLTIFAMAAAVLYSLCGILRLVRYNVMQNVASDVAPSSNFTGLPIPAGMATLFSVVFFLQSDYATRINSTYRVWITAIATIIVAYFMVSRWKFPSLKRLHLKVPTINLVLISIFLLTVLLGVVYFFEPTLLIVSWGYLILGFSLSMIRLIAGRKSKTLADFEPEDDLDEDL